MKTRIHRFDCITGIRRTKILLFFCLIFLKAIYAQENNVGKVVSNPSRVEIPGTHFLQFTSKIVGQEYDLYIHLPRNYSNNKQKYPVLYLLDAQWDFPLVTAIYGQQFYDGFLPGLIIIGITWGGKTPNHDSLRARDLTPTNVAALRQSGNAPKFLAFIKNELIPFVESQYRVTNDRTLMGSSLGGLFTLYTLFTETNLFQRCVLTSPALKWDNEVIYTYEKNYAEKHTQLPVRLFMAVGDFEEVADFQRFVNRLKARNYTGLMRNSRILENTGHSGTKAEGYTRGLQSVFARPSLKLASKVLKTYVGVYQLNPTINIKIIIDKEHLIVLGPDNSETVLHAETESDFYVPGQYLFAHFQKDAMGKIIGMRVEQFANETFLQKVN